VGHGRVGYLQLEFRSPRVSGAAGYAPVPGVCGGGLLRHAHCAPAETRQSALGRVVEPPPVHLVHDATPPPPLLGRVDKRPREGASGEARPGADQARIMKMSQKNEMRAMRTNSSSQVWQQNFFKPLGASTIMQPGPSLAAWMGEQSI